jgi:hypothetical protein
MGRLPSQLIGFIMEMFVVMDICELLPNDGHKRPMVKVGRHIRSNVRLSCSPGERHLDDYWRFAPTYILILPFVSSLIVNARTQSGVDFVPRRVLNIARIKVWRSNNIQ